jgi:uncharacterized protein (DUF58 family)
MIKTFYLNNIVYYIAGLASVVFVVSYFQPALFRIGGLILILLVLSIIVDAILVYSKKKGIEAKRLAGERFSIGDNNKIILRIRNDYRFPVRVSIIDELPIQFQERKWLRKARIASEETHELEYLLRPLTRGEYVFEDMNVFVHGPLGLVKRRYIFSAHWVVKVYPSYLQMRRYQLLAVSNRLQEAGVRKLRRIGHSMEFEQIKEYVRGDDYRTINWKATARKDG